MSHHSEIPTQSQPSSSNSTRHRKKKRKHRALPVDNNLTQQTTTITVSISTETGRSSNASGSDELISHVHHAVTVFEDMPSPKPLRQRSSLTSCGSFGDSAVDDSCSSVNVATTDTVKSLLELKESPVTYFLGKVYSGNSLWSTTSLGNENERERVYDTIFRLPWRCELLIDVGFFVCFNSFLSLLTVMPTRIVMTSWKLLKTRKFKRPSTIELSDFSCFLIIACGVTVLQQIDISLIYHMIRGQATIKLYVIYNVLEIFDKLCQIFNGDVLQMLFHSAEGLARCPPETGRMGSCILRFISDQFLAVVTTIVHSFILLAQAITLSACIVAHYNALPALLVSNNFAEIKSYVFKGYNKDNVHSMVYFDSIERFHILAFILFVLAQNILEAEGSWLGSFLMNSVLVYVCEMAIDMIKHSFIAKFNNITPIAYSEFLEALCKQTLQVETENIKKKLIFVPLAPACVVIRVLTPVYAANLPYNPLPWKLFWILPYSAITYMLLTSLKILIGMVLQKHATWYVNRCQRRENHLHAD